MRRNAEQQRWSWPERVPAWSWPAVARSMNVNPETGRDSVAGTRKATAWLGAVQALQRGWLVHARLRRSRRSCCGGGGELRDVDVVAAGRGCGLRAGGGEGPGRVARRPVRAAGLLPGARGPGRAGLPPRAAALGPGAPGRARSRAGARPAGRRGPARPRLAAARPVVAGPGRGDRGGPPVYRTAWPRGTLPFWVSDTGSRAGPRRLIRPFQVTSPSRASPGNRVVSRARAIEVSSRASDAPRQ